MLDVAVVGGGPVGLLCAVALRLQGRAVTLLERRAAPRSDSRSIGIHAASLARMRGLGVLTSLLERGIQIERGVALGSRGRLGTIEFRAASTRFGFALAVPQAQTEALLEARAHASGVELVRGANVNALEHRGDHVVLGYDHQGQRRSVSARYLLGCDGAHSSIRRLLKVGVRRQALRGNFWMAEFPAKPELGTDAWIYLADQGLVESFPLPGDRRRWVVEVEARRDQVNLRELCRAVQFRCGQLLEPDAGSQPSAFGVTQLLAQKFRCGRVLLLGDAAHVLSPFGGQGMNLGWLDALALAEVFAGHWTVGGLADAAVTDWEQRRRKAAKIALRQAAWNTRIGRRTACPRLRNALVRVALLPPFAAHWSRRFAMVSLGGGTL
ncbi:Salicylate hydroxylase [Enhygromyxa salina]|uniref:Salicylate hydroxylase n=1 Tax=Enhygromyxa salina TaxID=215803 RepID=A0A0C2CT45_9BACT|nr:NAD(P)/FAD-dependent oxidoreductase [Enhygromyxa salina]KIG14336.1 Salicylate hydroxylase [Enhygromyxa salina]